MSSQRNKTRVKWSITGDFEVTETNGAGHYRFNNVPLGHDVTMWIQADDCHGHNGAGQICKYERDKNIGQIGKVVLKAVPAGNRVKFYNFLETPVKTYDPCVNPYPVKFEDPF